MQPELRQYNENDPHFPPLVIYTRQHAEMTYEGVKGLIARYENAFRNHYVIRPGTLLKDIDQAKLARDGAVVPMSAWEIFSLLPYMYDATDPDSYWRPQDIHCLQVGLRGTDKMRSLLGFMHDFSKAILGIDMGDQLVVGGDIYPLGVMPRQVIGRKGKHMVPYADYGFDQNPDWIAGLYPKDRRDPNFEHGVYAEEVRNGTMNLNKLVMMFQHDRHLGIILDHMEDGDHNLPAEWMKWFKFLAKYHSFHALHDFDRIEDIPKGPYYWAADAEDQKMLGSRVVKAFKLMDLYTKKPLDVSDEEYRDMHYKTVQNLFAMYFPKPILVPIVSDRLPRLLRLMQTNDLVEILGLIAPAVRLNPESGVTLAASETDKLYKGEMINGFLEYLRIRAKKEKDGDLSRDLSRTVQEIGYELSSNGGSQFYGIGETMEDLLKGFDPLSRQSQRSIELDLAIKRVAGDPMIMRVASFPRYTM